MEFTTGNIYHIYNRGNGRQTIFFNDDNYLYFLNKVRKYISPTCDILAYVLMPNHFHFLIHANENTEKRVSNSSAISKNVLSEGLRLLLSSYTKGINKQQGTTGNLITQNTRSKCVHNYDAPNENSYGNTCFQYIHQNPVKAGLVKDMSDWQYSSFKDYSGLRNGTLCNKELAKDFLYFDPTFTQIDEKLLTNIW